VDGKKKIVDFLIKVVDLRKVKILIKDNIQKD
jgi:hypothetical protein